MKNTTPWAVRAASRLLVMVMAALIGLAAAAPSLAQAVDPVARGLAARANTPDGILAAGGVVYAKQDILLAAGGQSNSSAGWSVLSGDRQLTAADIADDRIRILDVGKGAELVSNPDFDTGTTGWSSGNATLAAVNGRLEATATNASFPTVSFTVSGLTIGKTYELTGDLEPVTANLTLRLGSLNEVKGTRFSNAAYLGGGRLVGMRAQFTATATSHAINISSTSGTTPTGSVFMRADNVSLREVLTTGVSYPKAVVPLGGDADFTNIAAMGIDPIFHMAKRLLDRGVAKRVVIIATAVGGTGFSDNNWTAPSGTLYAGLKTKLTAALADNPFAVPALAWVQGEQDAVAGWSQDQYITAFKAMVTDLRGIEGAENMQVIVGEMVPEYVNSVVTSGRTQGTSANHRRIDAAHRQLPNLIPGVTFVQMDFGYQKSGEAYHYNAAGARRLGYLMGEALWSHSMQTSANDNGLRLAANDNLFLNEPELALRQRLAAE